MAVMKNNGYDFYFRIHVEPSNYRGPTSVNYGEVVRSEVHWIPSKDKAMLPSNMLEKKTFEGHGFSIWSG